MLIFKYKNVLDELHAFVRLLKAFVVDESQNTLDRWVTSLQIAQHQCKSGDSITWAIPDDEGMRVRTIVSDRKKEKAEWRFAYAEFSMIWEIEDIRGKRDNTNDAKFKIEKLASMRVRLYRPEDESDLTTAPVALWHFDVATPGALGTQFHSQMDWGLSGKPIEIPRFPALVVLPSDAMSFMQHELFPISWARKVAANPDLGISGKYQRERLARLLGEWTKSVTTTSDPVQGIVSSRCPSEVFL